MGVVYKAEDTRLASIRRAEVFATGVASDAQALARFQREAQAASRAESPNICTIYDHCEQDAGVFLAGWVT